MGSYLECLKCEVWILGGVNQGISFYSSARAVIYISGEAGSRVSRENRYGKTKYFSY